MFFVNDSFIGNLNAQIPAFLLAILIKLLTSKFILQKAQIYYAPTRFSLLPRPACLRASDPINTTEKIAYRTEESFNDSESLSLYP